MRKEVPKLFTKRIIRRFLFFPKTLGKSKRWLEWANIEQELCGVRNKRWWHDLRWLDEETVNETL